MKPHPEPGNHLRTDSRGHSQKRYPEPPLAPTHAPPSASPLTSTRRLEPSSPLRKPPGPRTPPQSHPTAIDPLSMQKLPIWAVTGQIYTAAWLHRGQLFRALFLPFVMSLLFFAAVELMHAQVHTQWQRDTLLTVGLLVQVYGLMSLATLSAYRVMLLDDRAARRAFTDAWLYRYLRYLRMSFLSTLPSGLMLFGAAVLLRSLPLADWQAWSFALLSLMLAPLLYLRLGFVLPATAADTPYNLRDSWRVTGAVWLPLVGITLVTYGPLFVLMLGASVAYETSKGLGWQAYPLAGLFFALWYLGGMLHVVAHALCFCLRTQWHLGARRIP